MCAANAAKTRPGNAAVAAAFARAENRICFIDDDDDRPERANGHQDAHLLPFRVADPFRAKLADLHHRQSAFAGEAIDEKRFADADATRHEDAALDDVGLAVLKEPRDLAQLLLRGFVGRDEVETDARLRIFEAHEPLAVLFDQSFLARADVFGRDAFAIADRSGDQVLNAQQVETRGARREIGGGEIARVGEPDASVARSVIR